MATLEARISALASAIGADIKVHTTAIGTLPSLITTAKSNLVAAINEVATAAASASEINDTSTTTSTTTTYSANKINDLLTAAKAAVKTDLINGAGTALDTLNELAAALGNDPNFATTIATDLGNRVRFDAVQTLTSPQKTQARDNIDAAAASDLTTLTTGLGTYDTDYVAVYTTAKT